jgi:hypothetical protein
MIPFGKYIKHPSKYLLAVVNAPINVKPQGGRVWHMKGI